MESVIFFIVGIIVIAGIAWWGAFFYSLADATKKDAAEGKVTWVHGAIWAFFGTCLLGGLIRSCQ